MKKIITLISILLLSSLIFLYYKYDNKSISEIKTKQELKNSSMLSLMIETEAGSGKYNVSTTNTFPSDEYVFNKNLSKCENGSELSWDEQEKLVILKGDITDKCYVYFDVYVEPVVTLSNYVISKYTGTQGENNIYYHDSSLTNGAGDNSYRYAGSNPNNYVCFGSDETSCPDDNLYRIIGVFDGKTKLIKADYVSSNLLGTDGDYGNTFNNLSLSTTSYKGNKEISAIAAYYWNYKNTDSNNDGMGINTWSTSLLNKTNLNTNYLNNIGSKWNNMIVTVTWKVGGSVDNNITKQIPQKSYEYEIVNPSTTDTVNAKIGLMYVSDYSFAAPSTAWNSILDYTGYGTSTISSNNWLYLGLHEWTITRNSMYNYAVNNIQPGGGVYGSAGVTISYARDAIAVRPTFYLNSSVIFSSGDGTKTNPIRILAE